MPSRIHQNHNGLVCFCPKKRRLQRFVQMAYEQSLYEPNWCFQNMYRRFLENKESYTYIEDIIVGFIERQPIGVSVVWKEKWVDVDPCSWCIGCWVNASFRQRGIGRELVNVATHKYKDKKFLFFDGIRGARTFWHKVLGDRGLT